MSGELTTSLPKGGAPGQVLTKVSYDNYKVDWKTPQQGGGGETGSGWILPTGCIVIWSGSESSVPDGFALCNGQNGTPDLRDKFVLGSGAKYSVGDTGGKEEVTLTLEQMPKHKHEMPLTLVQSSSNDSHFGYAHGIYKDIRTPNTSEVGSSQPHPNMPPYYTLAYIIKI